MLSCAGDSGNLFPMLHCANWCENVSCDTMVGRMLSVVWNTHHADRALCSGAGGSDAGSLSDAASDEDEDTDEPLLAIEKQARLLDRKR